MQALCRLGFFVGERLDFVPWALVLIFLFELDRREPRMNKVWFFRQNGVVQMLEAPPREVRPPSSNFYSLRASSGAHMAESRLFCQNCGVEMHLKAICAYIQIRAIFLKHWRTGFFFIKRRSSCAQQLWSQQRMYIQMCIPLPTRALCEQGAYCFLCLSA